MKYKMLEDLILTLNWFENSMYSKLVLQVKRILFVFIKKGYLKNPTSKISTNIFIL